MGKYVFPMKFLILVLAFLARQEALLAQCNWYDVSVYPPGGEVSTRPIIFIEGLAAGIDVIDGIKAGKSVFLQSGPEKVKLLVKDAKEGQFFIAQVLLEPEKSLTPNKVYELIADSLPHAEKFERWDSETKGVVRYRFFVVAEPDASVISMAKLPVCIINNVNRRFSCGVEETAIFDYQIRPADRTHVFKATVKDRTTGTVSSYYILSDRSTIPIGHRACGGPFEWRIGHTYQLTLEYLDPNGKLKTLTNPVTFKSPIQ